MNLLGRVLTTSKIKRLERINTELSWYGNRRGRPLRWYAAYYNYSLKGIFYFKKNKKIWEPPLSDQSF